MTESLLAPYVGMIVQWFPDQTAQASAFTAETCSVNQMDGRLTLIVREEMAVNGRVKYGVFHRNSPRAKRSMEIDQDAGVWDYTPETKLLMAVADKLAAVKEAMPADSLDAMREAEHLDILSRRDRVRAARDAGKTIAAIAEEENVSVTTVHKDLKATEVAEVA